MIGRENIFRTKILRLNLSLNTFEVEMNMPVNVIPTRKSSV